MARRHAVDFGMESGLLQGIEGGCFGIQIINSLDFLLNYHGRIYREIDILE